MITKEQIREKKERINKKLDNLYGQLEHIWDWAMEKGYHGLATAADNAQHQFVGATSVSDVKSDIYVLIEDLYDVLEENEKVKDLPKLLDFQMAFDQIRADVKRWDKQLYPEDYPNE